MKLIIKPCILLCSLLSISILSFSQIPNYTAIRDSVYISKCGERTRYEVNQSIMNLESFTVNASTVGAHSYHYDLGMCYYLLSINEDFDEVGLRTAIRHFEKSIEYKSKHEQAYWNLALISAVLKECEQSAKYLKLYKKHVKRKYAHDKEQINLVKNRCNN
jgi:hypothetical protein